MAAIYSFRLTLIAWIPSTALGSQALIAQRNHMSIRFFEGSVLLSGGSVALSEDCCCGEPCVCAVEATLPVDCECVQSAYNTDYGTTAGAIVTITGPAPPGANNGVGDCSTLLTCCDVSGTYVLDCGESIDLCCYTYICEFLDAEVYAYIRVLIDHIGTTTGDAVRVEVRSGTIQYPTGTVVPTGELIACVAGGTVVFGVDVSKKIRRFNLAPTEFLPLWRFVLGGSCSESCNEFVTQRKCNTASTYTITDQIAFRLDDPKAINESGCDVTVLTFSAIGR